MATANSSSTRRSRKYANGTTGAAEKFPLNFHSGSGLWRKQINGKDYYFGSDRDEALREHLRVVDDVKAGRKPRPKKPEFVTVEDCCDHLVNANRGSVSDALDESIKQRRKPKSKAQPHSDLVFIMKYGNPWGTAESGNCPITREFRKLLDKCELYQRGKSFYSLRHVFRDGGR